MPPARRQPAPLPPSAVEVRARTERSVCRLLAEASGRTLRRGELQGLLSRGQRPHLDASIAALVGRGAVEVVQHENVFGAGMVTVYALPGAFVDPDATPAETAVPA